MKGTGSLAASTPATSSMARRAPRRTSWASSTSIPLSNSHIESPNSRLRSSPGAGNGPNSANPRTNAGPNSQTMAVAAAMRLALRAGVSGWWTTSDLGKGCDMPRTIWKGALSFGLVNVPVGLYPATSDKSIHFNQFEEGTSDRIRYKKVNERTGKEVTNDEIVRGFDHGGVEYVIVT